MREPLRIAVAQPVCVRHDVAGNAVRHARVVRSARARVVVFPELSLTGYELDAATMTGTIENALTGKPAVASRDGRGQEIGIMQGAGPRYYVRSFKGNIALRPR